MSLRKRGSVWWIDFAAPNGERVRRSAETDNKAQAQELHDKLKSEVWGSRNLGIGRGASGRTQRFVGSASRLTRPHSRTTRKNCDGSIAIWPIENSRVLIGP